MGDKQKNGIIGGIITVVIIIAIAVFGDKVDFLKGFANEPSTNEQVQNIVNDSNIESKIKNNSVNNGINDKFNNVEGLKDVAIVTGEECLTTIPNDDYLRVYCLDVGQGDSILISHKGNNMLIDASTNDMGNTVVKDLEKLGIKKIDFVVGTHPHEDHIGGLDNVIKKFEIGKVVMPKKIANTKTYEDVLNAVKKKNMKISTPKVGTKFNVGDAECEVMAVDTSEEDVNESSIVIKMTYKDVNYLFTGDANYTVESSRQWPEIDILKVGHHGSSSSSTKKFLDQIKPKVSLISVGQGNTYGHPTESAIKRLKNVGSIIYRTDEVQSILVVQK